MNKRKGIISASHSSGLGWCAGVIAILICMPCVDGKNYILHSKKWPSECLIHQETVLNNSTQYGICREWTHDKPLQDWNMSMWQTLSNNNDPRLDNSKITLLPGESALYSTINYTTSVQLPEILKKITNIDLSIKVSKKIFIANHKLHAFIDIQKVPVVGFIKISTILSVMETNIILARHMISHGDVPWFARWATDLLKKQVVQSVDEYDEVSIRMYCQQQDLQEKHPVLP
jgi:hypothetical protein